MSLLYVSVCNVDLKVLDLSWNHLRLKGAYSNLPRIKGINNDIRFFLCLLLFFLLLFLFLFVLFNEACAVEEGSFDSHSPLHGLRSDA